MEQTLGKRIVTNRKRMGLTQDQLAERLGVTAQAVSKWENDQSCPDITMLPKLAEIFGVTTDELLGRESVHAAFEGEVVDEEENEVNGLHVQKGNWEFKWDSGRRSALTYAILVLLFGGLMLTAKVLHWDVSWWEIFWPVTLLVYGLRAVLRKFSFFGLGCTLFGGYFLIENLGFWKLDLGSELIFPIIVVIFGLSLLVDALRKPKKPRIVINHNGNDVGKTKSTFETNGEHFDCSLSFGENTRYVTLPRLSSGTANVSFGELVVDLTGCGEIANGCEIDASCSFGQLVLKIPRSCRAVSKTGTAFGAVEFVGHPNVDAATDIVIDGRVSFGEIEVQYI